MSDPQTTPDISREELVKRLRHQSYAQTILPEHWLMKLAADEIERMENEMGSMAYDLRE